MLAFKLGGKEPVPTGKEPLGPVPIPTFEVASTADERSKGMSLFHVYCSICHGPRAVAGGSVPDLRHLTPEKHRIFDQIVRDGLFRARGMPGFADLLSEEDTQSIQAWILERARTSAGEAS